MIRFGLLLLPAALAAAPALMPLPVKVESAPGRLIVNSDFTVAATGASDPRLDAALNRLARRLARQTGIPILSPKPQDPARATLRVECDAAGAAWPTLGEDESYALD